MSSHPQSKAQSQAASPTRLPWLWMALTLSIGSLGTLAVTPPRPIASALNSTPAVSQPPSTFRDLLGLGAEEISAIDIARLNLLCAVDLPGSERLDVNAVLSTLNEWAQRVRFETERHLYRFRENPTEFENSEAYYRMLMMTTVIQQDFGVRYNPERARDPDFRDSRDLFIHGLLTGRHTGTCMSMPVLSVALGRRLGYPLKLAQAKSHLYVRWELGGSHHLNFEATSRGLQMFDDAYYQSWPEPLSPVEIASGAFLRSLTPREELATFMQARGHCLEDNGRLADAQLAYAHAHSLAPDFPYGVGYLADAVQRELKGSQLAIRPAKRSPSRQRSPEEMMRLADEINARNAERTRAQTQPPLATSIPPPIPYGVVP